MKIALCFWGLTRSLKYTIDSIKNNILEILDSHNIEYKIFDYVNRYSEEEYIDYLQHSKYGIILDAHESQGFAIEEALSCNVPLLVWGAKTMNQEYRSNPSRSIVMI